MKKAIMTALVALVAICFAATAFAGTLSPGQTTKCNNAKSITLTAKGTHPTDRGNANLSVWKSSNATTVPITLGPTDTHGPVIKKAVGMTPKTTMGRKSVTLKHQPNFSRGDSIGDISGIVKITNIGTIGVDVSCN